MWNDEGVDTGLDMEEYISKRMLEIPNLQERNCTKKLLAA